MVHIQAQTIMGRQNVDQYPRTAGGTLTYGLTWLPQSYNNSTRTYPLIISLHGTGEVGTTQADLARLYSASPRAISGRIADGWNANAVNPLTGAEDSFIVVSPQAASWSYGWAELRYILPNLLSRYRIDTSRIYLAGLSAGGGGSFTTLGSNDVNFIRKFAAVATASSAGVSAANGYTAEQVEANVRYSTPNHGVRVWTIAGEQDYLLNYDVRMHDSTNKLSPPRPNKLTVIQSVGHSAWGRAYDPAFRPTVNYYGNSGTCNNGCNNGGITVAPNANGSPVRGSGVTQDSLNLYEWFLTAQRPVAVVATPTANAGADKVITLPVTTTTLNGSGTPGNGHTISSFAWTKTSGPSTFNIVSPGTLITVINSLIPGTYTFRLTVTNEIGATATDDVLVTVVDPLYSSPVINSISSGQTITLPISIANLTSTYTLTGASINSIKWTKFKVPGQAKKKIGVIGSSTAQGNGASSGDSSFVGRLKTLLVGQGVADSVVNLAMSGYSVFKGMPSNYVPTGNQEAPDVTRNITSILNRNVDVVIVSFPSNGFDLLNISEIMMAFKTIYDTCTNRGVKCFITTPSPRQDFGPTHQLFLKEVRDSILNRFGSDAINFYDPVTIPGTTQTMTAYAAGDQIHLNNAGHRQLFNKIVAANILGSFSNSPSVISTPLLQNTPITALTAGANIFQLTITDSHLQSVNGFVTVTVNGALANLPPIANAGPDVNISLPTILATLNGSGTDPDGTIASFEWKRISGPNLFEILTPLSPITIVTSLLFGSYQFELTVVDNLGAIDKDTVNVNVTLLPNQLPVAIAGTDKTITLPVNTITQVGSGNDPDGTVASYQWNRISGPSQFTIGSPTSGTTVINDLVQGAYQFALTVTDNQGGSSSDTMSVIVNAPPNQAPVANAGTDKEITLPVSTISQVGSGSDPDGTIASYQWSKISGPAQFTIVAPTEPITGITNLAQGVYQFRLSVTDNLGSTAADTMSIIVNPAANQAPIANAGADKTLTIPVNNVIQTGSGSDPDGTITAYLWSKLTGPSQYAIITPTQPQTTINNLISGVYTFELRVTDNLNATGRDTVTITVNSQPPPSSCTGNNYTPVPSGDLGYYNTFNLQPGDTLFLDGQYTFSYVYLNGRHGTPSCPIVIINKNGQAKLRSNELKIENCSYIKVLGSGTPGVEYGISIRPYGVDTVVNGRFGVNIKGKSKNIEIAHVKISNAGIGMSIKHDPDCDQSYNYPNWVMDSITIRNNHITQCWNQGLYIGNTAPDNSPNGYSPRPIICNGQTVYYNPMRVGHIKVIDNFIDSTGRAGIQISSGSHGLNEIHNNTVRHSGMNGDPAQGNAIVLGSYTAATIHNNTISNTYSHGIASEGGSNMDTTIQVWNNIIDSSGYLNAYNLSTTNRTMIKVSTEPTFPNTLTWPYSVFMRAIFQDNIDSVRFSIKNNTFGIRKRVTYSIALFDQSNTMHAHGNVICGNVNTSGAPLQTIVEGANPVIWSTDCSGSPNLPPSANAGADKIITLPVNTVTLTGIGTDPDGPIASYQWSKIAGPGQFTIVSPTQTQSIINNLIVGVYQFEFTVTDNLGLIDKDTVLVTVNAANIPPVAGAGVNQTIKLPVNTVTVIGTGTDGDGTIAGYLWSKISGPSQFTIVSPTQSQTIINNLSQGVYQFELRVTDNGGAIGKDTILITVNPANLPPVSNAGPDRSIVLPVNSVTINGSGTDADGLVSFYQWSKIAGPSQFTIVSPSQGQTVINNLLVGIYQFELRVTDNEGATDNDTVVITVHDLPPPNQPPTANAGADQSITLPLNTITLNGSGTDVDGTISTYQWSKIAGPAQFTIVSPTQAQTVINNLIQGIYQFELTVTDNEGATGKDTVTVNVNAAPPPVNIAPTANAGANQTITLPVNTTTVTGSGTDVDGTITSYQWSKIAGPTQFTIVSPTQAQTVINNLIQGVYQFELTVADNQGATGKDTITIAVNAAVPPGNVAPTADAGANQTIILPVNTVTVIGSATDIDGTITSYQWSKISGPTQFTIVSPTQAQTVINNLIQGVYQFELTVTDNLGAIGKDTMTVTVNGAVPPANIAPTAIAGLNFTITLPVNAITVTGSGTDPDGTINSYLWSKISGPATYTIVSPNQAQTVINNMVQGHYQFALTVTDNQGATGKDTIDVIVNSAIAPPPNQPPVANAGQHLNITLPTTTVSMTGSGTDVDGTIVSQEWKKIEGPSQYSILFTSQLQTSVSDLVEGSYKFELKVTDNQGATGKDTIAVTVHPAIAVVEVFPNPASSVVTLKMVAKMPTGPTSIQILDARGRTVYTERFTRSQQVTTKQIDVSKFPRGPYIIVLDMGMDRVKLPTLILQ